MGRISLGPGCSLCLIKGNSLEDSRQTQDYPGELSIIAMQFREVEEEDRGKCGCRRKMWRCDTTDFEEVGT